MEFVLEITPGQYLTGAVHCKTGSLSLPSFSKTHSSITLDYYQRPAELDRGDLSHIKWLLLGCVLV